MVIFDIWKGFEKVNEMTLDIQFYCVYITLKKMLGCLVMVGQKWTNPTVGLNKPWKCPYFTQPCLKHPSIFSVYLQANPYSRPPLYHATPSTPTARLWHPPNDLHQKLYCKSTLRLWDHSGYCISIQTGFRWTWHILSYVLTVIVWPV